MIFSLITNLEHLDVILASESPRRFELLNLTGINFKVVSSRFNEESVRIIEPYKFVQEVSFQKGNQVATKHPDKLVISADTIVILDNKILGKPKDEGDAFKMLEFLAGKTHTVLTSFSLFLLKYEKMVTETVGTQVTIREMHKDEIWAYVNTGEPMDKAGAYAIQGQGALLVEKKNGSYSNVVGFPIAKFFTTLNHFLEGLALQG